MELISTGVKTRKPAKGWRPLAGLKLVFTHRALGVMTASFSKIQTSYKAVKFIFPSLSNTPFSHHAPDVAVKFSKVQKELKFSL